MTPSRGSGSILTATALLLSSLVPSAHAATIISGQLFFTTFQNESGTLVPLTTNVWKVDFVYDSVLHLCLGSTTFPCPALSGTPPAPKITAIKTLTGADGLIFDPNDAMHHTLLIGEQESNRIAKLSTDGTVLVEQRADGANPFSTPPSVNGQAYGVTATPDKMHLISLPNDPSLTATGFASVNVSPLQPFGDGTTHPLSGLDTQLRGLAFDGAGTAFYGTATDYSTAGFFGTLDLGTFATTRVAIVDDVDSSAGQGSLPSHALTFDSFTNCMILSGHDQIWQLCPQAGAPSTFHIVAKVTAGGAGTNWDQTSVDGAGHLFAANNNGTLLFIDYSVSKNISSPVFSNALALPFLANDLDDIVNGGGAPPSAPGRMTGGGSVFEADGTRVTHGFELHCETSDLPNRLEINWNGNRFHLETLTFAFCFDDPSFEEGPPEAPFNTYVGRGTGDYNGVPGATASWTFTDAGEPGTNDHAIITIKDAGGATVLFVSNFLDKGNQQAHNDNK